MHTRSFFVPPYLSVVAAFVVVVAHVTRLVHVLKTMDYEPQGEPPILDRLRLVADNFSEFIDLVHDTALGRHVALELRVVTGLIKRNVHIVSGGCLGESPPVLVRPE
jgi:hypothetical protein